MNAHTFDNSHSVVCPICHRTGQINPGQMLGGLYTCPHCQARLVISLSGHYVRDPFRSAAVEQLLRRQSRPWARILRDAGLTKPGSLIVILASAVLAGVTLAMIQGWTVERNPIQDSFESVSEIIELIDSTWE